MDPISLFLEHLSADQARSLHAAPRSQRLSKLAQVLTEDEQCIIQTIAAATQYGALETIENPLINFSALPIRLLTDELMIPLQIDEKAQTIELVSNWPPDEILCDWIYALTQLSPTWKLCTTQKIVDQLHEMFGIGSASLENSELMQSEEPTEEVEDEDAAIIRFVNEVISQALKDRATDIHFEPQRNNLTLRYRIDGHLVPVQVPENLHQFQPAIMARLKVMARLNISERRRPQDGRISFKVDNTTLDIRISTLPTLFGESISLRLLQQQQQTNSVESLGMNADLIAKIEPILKRPHGIILVTGPTGSGKSTTLNAFMRKIRAPERRIVTVEDPIEYEVSGINQTQINSEIGLSFAQALRHVLRQDPDVIMVGEIRDTETASIAIRASLTGHLVFSSLHTNDAAGALTRLIDMGTEPFLIASSIQLVIAQRLVRRLCPACRQKQTHTASELQQVMQALEVKPPSKDQVIELYQANGCEQCQQSGYQGRIGLFEALKMHEDLNTLVLARKSAQTIRQTAIEMGMETLQSCGWQHALKGATSLSEVMRFADDLKKAATR